MQNRRTDLALEMRNAYISDSGAEPEGIDFSEYLSEGIKITRIEIQNEKGEQALQKPCGLYYTLSLNRDWLLEEDPIMRTASALSDVLVQMLPKSGLVLIAGLGNRSITPDNLGPLLIENVIVTRHLVTVMPEEFGDMRPVCALAPGVLGITGIETAEILKGVSERVKPAAIIAVDALAARDESRLCRTFQVSSTGIIPGGGISNSRNPITEQTMGVPVISIGLPTVIDSHIMIMDFLDSRGIAWRQEMFDNHPSLFVTTKDIDLMMKKSAKIIGYGVNFALHGRMSPEEIEQFLQ